LDIALHQAPQFAKANGIELCYEIFGAPDAQPLILIMGLAAQMVQWDDEFCEQLAARGFRVIRFDNRDIGKSTYLAGGGAMTPAEWLKFKFLRIAPAAPYKLRDMALATPGAAGRTGQETSVGTFLTDLNRMRQQTPAGYRALFSDPAVARRIEALATVADTMKETAKRANVSGTGPYMALGEAGSTAVATWLATHSPTATALSVAAPFVVNRAAGMAATNPLATRIASAPGPRNLPNPLLTGLLVDNEEQRRRNALTSP